MTRELLLISAVAFAIAGCASHQATADSGIYGDSSNTQASPVEPHGPTSPTGAAAGTGAPDANRYVSPTAAPALSGPQGSAGRYPAQGNTLVGPAGPAAHAGDSGTQGVAGHAGSQDQAITGIAGARDASDAARDKRSVGNTGGLGPAGLVIRWTSYKDFNFEPNNTYIQPSQEPQVAEIAAHMKKNPSLKIGIDGTDPHNQTLSDRRVKSVRDSLIYAGVPAEKISEGAFGDQGVSHVRRVEILLCTDN